MLWKRATILLYLCFLVVAGFGQLSEDLFKKASSETGLRNNSIITVAEDNRGYLWFGTWFGLYRKDGSGVKLYSSNPTDSLSLASNKIVSTLFDSKGRLWVGSLRGGLYRYNYGVDRFKRIIYSDAEDAGPRNNIWAILEDQDGLLWLGTEKGVIIYDPIQKEFQENGALLNQEIEQSIVYHLFKDTNNGIWLGTDKGLFQFKKSEKGSIYLAKSVQFSFPNFPPEESNFITFLKEDTEEENLLLIGSKAGLIQYNLQDDSYQLILENRKGFDFPRNIWDYSKYPTSLFIGTQNGLYQIDKKSKQLKARFLENRVIRSIKEDQFGTLWVGTETGLLKLDLTDLFINNILLGKTDDNRDAEVVSIKKSPFSQDLWLAWQNGQLSRIPYEDDQLAFKKIQHFQIRLKNQQLFQDRISQLAVDEKGKIWVATQGAGLLVFSEQNISAKSQIIPTDQEISKAEGLSDSYLMSLLVDQNNIWIGTWSGGLNRYNPVTNQIDTYQKIPKGQYDLAEIPIVEIQKSVVNGQEKLWIGTRGAGVFCFDINPQHDLIFKNKLEASQAKVEVWSSNFINQILVAKDRIYFPTEKEICVYYPSNNHLERLQFKGEQVEGIVQSMFLSAEGTIWLANSLGEIFELQQEGQTYIARKFTNPDIRVYANNSLTKDAKNKIIFGGINGISIIDESQKRPINQAPIPVITDFKIDNKSVKPGQEINKQVKLSSVIEETRFLKLTYQDKIFSISFAGIHSEEPFELNYAYQLEGFHEDWIFTDQNNTVAHFTQLRYGDYTFKVKVANSSGIWSPERKLKIKVAPPWWLNPWAFAAYILIAALIFLAGWRILMIKTNYDNQLKLEKLERSKLEELNQMKIQFYTSISHDLRTPLTLILSPLEELLNQVHQQDLKKKFHLIYRNASKLSEMINQLLEFRKFETGKVELHPQDLDIVEFCHESLLAFAPLAEKNKLELIFETNIPKFHMAFDPQQIVRVINNLLSNAIKFSPKGGDIKLRLLTDTHAEQVKISVEDQGIGIPKEDLKHIFDRFYRSKNNKINGYGIGLSLAKNIIEEHQGQIQASSVEGEGSIFQFTIPSNLIAFNGRDEVHPDNTIIPINSAPSFIEKSTQQEVFDETLNALNPGNKNANEEQKILIVEDNIDIRNYLKENLKSIYQVLEAEDGKVGWDLIQHELPDIIISDIAMPRMDGIELCQLIKSNPLTCHIPVILLTARSSQDNKFRGYDMGADIYITKPFNLKVLMLRLKNLVQLKANNQKRFQEQMKSKEYAPSELEELNKNQEFIQKIIQIIEDGIETDKIGVEEISKKLLMSRVQFYRKLKAVTGLTPNTFIRQIRLKRAAQLLKTEKYSISEVTYKVGFQDLKYFREKFREFYGMNPSEYLDQERKAG